MYSRFQTIVSPIRLGRTELALLFAGMQDLTGHWIDRRTCQTICNELSLTEWHYQTDKHSPELEYEGLWGCVLSALTGETCSTAFSRSISQIHKPMVNTFKPRTCGRGRSAFYLVYMRKSSICKAYLTYVIVQRTIIRVPVQSVVAMPKANVWPFAAIKN